MNEAPVNLERRIIPRWRCSDISKNSRDVTSFAKKNLRQNGKEYIFLKKQRWEKEKSLETASDFVCSAFAQGMSVDATDAAEYIQKIQEKVYPELIEISKKVLLDAGVIKNEVEIEKSDLAISLDEIYAQIHIIRNRLISFPYNAFLWVDLSQMYIRVNQVEKALKAMKNAVFLAQNNRFVLRSATRLYIHLHRPEIANKLLLQSEVTKVDPWLLSAEIATATVEGKTSNLLKTARVLLESNKFPPFHLSELASAIGTVEYKNGAIKKAKKLFQFSLLDPTENSVAQSIWANRGISSLDLSDAFLTTPKIYEAQARKAYFEMNWDSLVESTKKWLFDEPFSSRPAEVGSFAAADGLGDYKLGEDFSRFGLIANPDDTSLLNNLAFSLANQGKTTEALEKLKKAKNLNPSGPIEIALRATEGLVNFRLGDYFSGQNDYLSAIKMAKERSLTDYQNRASLYYAMEMIRAGLYTKNEALEFALPNTMSDSSPMTIRLIDKLLGLEYTKGI